MLVLTLFTMAFSPQAQSAFNIKMGILNFRLADEQGRHHGQSIGFDVLVQDSRLLFMPGLHYQQYMMQAKTSRDGILSQGDKTHQIQLPISIGALIVNDRLFKLRTYAGGHISFLVGVDENTAGLTVNHMKEVQPGIQGGIQLAVWRFTADLRYIHDFRNVISLREESKLRGWEILVGIAL